MIKWSSLVTPSALRPSPTVMFRSTRSFISTQRFQTICLVSIFKAFPCWIWLSSIAANKLLAEVMAWKSPVKCRFNSSIGTTWAYPPPAAPPFNPKHGPSDGSRRAITAFFPILSIACPSPTVVVVFPSPAGVGFMAVTSTSLPFGRSFILSHKSSVSFALYFPYKSSSSSSIQSFSATRRIGSSFASPAISISAFICILHSCPFPVIHFTAYYTHKRPAAQ